MPTDRFQTWSELRDRIHKFSPNVTLHTKGIYYLPQHSKQEVFRRWLAVNDLEDLSDRFKPWLETAGRSILKQSRTRGLFPSSVGTTGMRD